MAHVKPVPLPPSCLQQPYETAAMYRAFVDFYLPAPRPRNKVEVYWLYQQSKSKNPAKVKRQNQASGTWNNWAAGKLDDGTKPAESLTWDERVKDYDKQVDEQLEGIRAAQRIKEVERELEATGKLLALFDKTMESAPAFLTSKRIEEQDGKVTHVYETVALNVQGLNQLATLHANIMNQRRLALGMAQKVSELQHGNKDKEPFKLQDTSIDRLIRAALDELEETEDE